VSSHVSHPVTVAAPRRPVVPRGAAFWLVAAVFATTMLGTTLPSPLYVLYEQQLGFAALMTTVIFAVYAAGVLAALLLLGRASDGLGAGGSCWSDWPARPCRRWPSCSRTG
jgi:MFS family permease